VIKYWKSKERQKGKVRKCDMLKTRKDQRAKRSKSTNRPNNDGAIEESRPIFHSPEEHHCAYSSLATLPANLAEKVGRSGAARQG
jgi:hypothetical protein